MPLFLAVLGAFLGLTAGSGVAAIIGGALGLGLGLSGNGTPLLPDWPLFEALRPAPDEDRWWLRRDDPRESCGASALGYLQESGWSSTPPDEA